MRRELSAFVFLLVWAASLQFACAAPPTRTAVLATARAFAGHEWNAAPVTQMHGTDQDGVEVQTPDAGSPGVAYKWGGFDSLASYDRGLAAGKAAGDIYSAEKRRRGGDAVSRAAVGVDCSGLVSRCWGLAEKHSTGTLVSISRALASTADLKAGDIMNQPGGHVLIFAHWLDETRERALFYEAEPFSKVRASEKELAELWAAGFRPMRYRRIREE